MEKNHLGFKIFPAFFFLCIFFFGSAFAKDVPLHTLKVNCDHFSLGSEGLKLKGDDCRVFVPVDDQAEAVDRLDLDYRISSPRQTLSVIFQRKDGFESWPQSLIVEGSKNAFNRVQIDLQSFRHYEGGILYCGFGFEGADLEIVLKHVALNKAPRADYLVNRVKELFRFARFIPATINYITIPTWRGQRFSRPVVFGLGCALSLLLPFCFAVANSRGRRYFSSLAVFLVVVVWLFFDVIHTINQTRMCHWFVAAEDIMQNSRAADASSEFPNFLTFIKDHIPRGKRGIFLLPYPMHFEGTYHAYPHVRLSRKKGAVFAADDDWSLADYFFVANSRIIRDNNPPLFDKAKMELVQGENRARIKKIIPYKDDYTIYEVAK
ncbi:MAG: hypothetical protein HQM16_08705 [Deltaproteobacteria bacterium]|nr:hypothetical protein [Deltaproteobacteria bacterium]